jgi:ATP-dependent Lon protease
MGIVFSYEFSDTIHDRHIILDNGWKIVMGRGLDIWQKTNGWFDLSEFIQAKRQCKGCEVTYLRN